MASDIHHVSDYEYWMAELANLPMPTTLPSDGGPAQEGHQIREFPLKSSTANAMERIANGSMHAYFMICLAIIGHTLSRCTETDDIVVLTPIFDNTMPACNYVNTIIPLHLDSRRLTSLRETLEYTRSIVVGAQEHQNLPFETLTRSANNGREISKIAMSLKGLQNSDFTETANPTLEFIFDQKHQTVELKYDTARYSRDYIDALGLSVIQISTSLIKDPDADISRLSLLTPCEQAIVDKFNDTDDPSLLGEHTIVSLFQEAVARHPEALAVIHADRRLTYNELDIASTNFAQRITELIGNGTGKTVAVMLHRSADMIVSLLAVLKTGASYVPIDRDYPLPRITHILNDCGPQLIITDASVEIGDIPRLAPQIDSRPTAALLPAIAPDAAAYIIYTSGSTGNPKGVIIAHRSICNTLCWRRYYQGMGPKDVNLQIPSFSFDSSVEDIFTPLVSGSSLVVPQHDLSADLDHLAQLIKHEHVTTMLMTPGLYDVLLKGHPEIIAELRVVTLAGEGFGLNLTRRHFELAPRVRLVNEYGPTENSVCSTVQELRPENAEVLIGEPIPNVRCFVVDSRERLCPPGIPGNLAIAGHGLMTSYHNRPELTAERLHHVDAIDETAYLTGDRVVLTPYGLRFLGRIDRQLKVRGFRVEPEEIEHALLGFPEIQAAAVVPRPGLNGLTELAAYFVAAEDSEESNLRHRLAAILPSHLVPNHLVRLKSLPLTVHGKVDRAHLSAMADSESRQIGQSPNTPTEQALYDLWTEVLGHSNFGVKDDFFEIGGQSLRATLLVSRIRTALKREIGVKTVFANPTIEQLAHIVDEAETSTADVIPKVQRTGRYLASDEQKRIFLMCELDDTGMAYNVPIRVDFSGRVDATRMSEAIDCVIANQDSLRTTFSLTDGELWQLVSEVSDIELTVVEAKDEESLETTIANFVTPFDLRSGPLFRCTLIQLPDRSVLLLDTHHSISDGMSVNCLLSDLAIAYATGTSEAPALQYCDYSAWSATRDDSASRAYWTEQLASLPDDPDIPLDFPRPMTHSLAGAKHRFSAGRDLTDRLISLARSHESTLFSVLTAGYAMLLSKYSSQEELIIGTPVAGRTRNELNGTIGMFVNMLPLRVKATPKNPISSLIRQVHDTSLDAFSHQNCQFNTLVDLAHGGRESASTPLLKFAIVMENMDAPGQTFDDHSVRLSDISVPVSKFDLTLLAHESDEGLEFILEFRTDLFLPSTIERMANHLITLLSHMVNSPGQTVADLELVNATETEKLMSFNNTKASLPECTTILDIIRAHPETAWAVADTETRLGYGDLDKMSTALAYRLMDAGVKQGDVVALLFDQEAITVVAILGVMKAGAAYLPLDGQYPEQRLVSLIRSSGCVRLLHSASTRPSWLKETNIPCQPISLNEPTWYSPLENTGLPILNRKDLAYVIYTSGSTGEPKGVEVTHEGLLNLCTWFTQHFELTPEDRVSKYASPAFDACVWEIFPALYAGAELIFIPPEDRMDLFRIADFFEREEISVAWLPTQVCEQYFDIPTSPLRLLTTGGDRLTRFVPRPYRMVNNYGPTETTVCTTSYDVNETETGPIPIGKPIANTQVFVLDSQGHLAPIGVFGELCVSGMSLARGYRGRPDLTSEQFVSNPHLPGQLMYRTGDRARWRSDGYLEFGGRRDSQIKLRGHRIELDEIKHTILEYEGIREAAVVLQHQQHHRQGRIAAFYTTADEGHPTPTELAETLSMRLPTWMVPASFTELATIPLTPNGKVDTKQLETYETKPQPVDLKSPVNDWERRILAVWQEVLECSEISTDQTFFDAGGNSLLMMKVASKLKTELGIANCSVTQLFQYPTISALAAHLGSNAEQGQVFSQLRSRAQQRMTARYGKKQ